MSGRGCWSNIIPRGGKIAPSHGENRGSSPLGSANSFNNLEALNCGFGRHLQLFSNGRCFRRSVRGHPVIVRSRRLEEIGAVTAEPASVLAYKDDPRSHRGALRRANFTDALLAGKVQRKVSNGIAGLAAAGSSRHRQKTRQFLPAQASCRDPGTRLELRSHRRSSNANSLCSRKQSRLSGRQASWIELQFKSPLGPWSEELPVPGQLLP